MSSCDVVCSHGFAGCTCKLGGACKQALYMIKSKFMFCMDLLLRCDSNISDSSVNMI